jgi:hypothetical protein
MGSGSSAYLEAPPTYKRQKLSTTKTQRLFVPFVSLWFNLKLAGYFRHLH